MHRLVSRYLNMKYRSASFSAAFLSSVLHLPSCGAWVAPSNLYLNKQTRYRYVSSERQNLLLATVVPEGQDVTDLTSLSMQAQTVAKGNIVSRFSGGFVAIEIIDEYQRPQSLEKRERIPDLSGSAAPKNAETTSGDYLGRSVILPDGSRGVVIAHRPPLVFVYTDSTNQDEVDGGFARILSTMESISVDLKKQILNKFDNSLDENTSGETMQRAIFAPIPQIKDIALIKFPMLTGITMIDTLAPIGRGQNMLMIGHNIDEMRGFAVDFVKRQSTNENTKCIYANIDGNNTVMNYLEDWGLTSHVHIVAPTAGVDNKDDISSAAQATMLAGRACAIGEAYAIGKGMHALVVIDTIDAHKKLWDATTRVLVDVFGVDSVVEADRKGGSSSEMRAFYSSLIQRSAQYKPSRGGGSVTLLLLTTIPPIQPDEDTVFDKSDFTYSTQKVKERINLLVERNVSLTASNLRKIDIPIPSDTEGRRRLVLQHVDDLISMSDGQIWFDEKLEKLGRFPPIDPSRSITRIGIGADTNSRADAPAFRRVVEGLRLDLSQAAYMDQADLSNASTKQIRRQNALLLAMHQEAGKGGRKLSESCTRLLAASKGYFDNSVDRGATAGTEDGTKLVEGLIAYVSKSNPSLMREIDESLDLSDDSKEELTNLISSFF